MATAALAAVTTIVSSNLSAAAAVGPGPHTCAGGQTCVWVDTRIGHGPEAWPAQGLLHGGDATTSPALVSGLHPRYWRVADPNTYHLARDAGATVIEILSDLWTQRFRSAGAPLQPPWQNWARYSAWVTATVKQALAGHVAPDYWEIQNEPGASQGAPSPPSVATQLEQFEIAYRAIKAGDPRARVVGPSLALFEDHPWTPPGTSGPPQGLDFDTFLRFADSHRLHFDVLAWHELLTTPAPGADPSWWVTSPEVIVDHTRRLRALLAEHPSLGHPQLVVGEYAPLGQHLVPGWTVGYMAAIETANLDGAGVSCWPGQDSVGTRYDECARGLDGLLDSDQLRTRPLYWVHAAYAGMTGIRVSAASSDETTSVLATYSAGDRRTTILLGRHVSCTSAVNPECRQPASATPGPRPTTVDVTLPASSAGTVTVSVEHIPDGTAPMLVDPRLSATPSTVAVLRGGASLSIGPVADGDAYVITVKS